MAVVRSLVVKVGSDLTGLEKGLAIAGVKLTKFGSQMVKTGQTFTNTFTVPILAAGAALGALTMKAAQYGDNITTLASQTGMSVQKLQELEYIATQSDTSFEAMTGSMSKFTMKLKEAMNPESKTAQIMKALGISIEDQNGAMKSREQLFMEAIQATGGLTDETTQAMVASELFGRSFSELLPLMKVGADGIKKLSDRYKSLGLALTDDQIFALDAFSDKSEEVKLRVEKAFYLMAANSTKSLMQLGLFAENTLIPALQKLIEKAGDLADAFSKLDPPTQKSIVLAIGFVAAIGPAVTIVGNLAKALGAVSGALSTVAGWIGTVLPLLGSLAGYASALSLLFMSGDSSQKVEDWKNANPTIDQRDALAGFTKKVMGYKTWEESIAGGNQFTDLAKKNIKPGETSTPDPLDEYIKKMKSSADEISSIIIKGIFSDGAESMKDFASDGAESMKDFSSSIRGVIDAIRSQTSAWANFAGMFDIFERKYISGDRLMRRMKAQVKAMYEWQDSLVTLQMKGASDQFIQTLRMQGPGAVDYINALARMSPDQVKEYEGLYGMKNGVAGTQAGWAQQAQTYIENQINLEITGNQISNEADVDRVANQIIGKLRYAGIRI